MVLYNSEVVPLYYTVLGSKVDIVTRSGKYLQIFSELLRL